MEKTVISFDDIEVNKKEFDQHKRPILIDNIDVNN